MLKVRLQRVGKKNQPSFRVVLTDSKNGPRSGRFLEVLGWHNPLKREHSFDAERIKYWISKGAQASGSVHNLLVRDGIVKGRKVDVAPRAKATEEEKSDAVAPEAVAEAPKVEAAAETPAESK